MTPTLGPFWALLVQDQAGRRALLETLTDWRQERERAVTPEARRHSNAGGVASVARVLMGLANQQVADLATWRVMATTLAVAALWPAIFSVQMAVSAPAEALLPAPGAYVALAFSFLLAIALPAVSLRNPRGSSDDPPPVLGVMVLSAAACVLLVSTITALAGAGITGRSIAGSSSMALALVFAAPTFVFSGEAMRCWLQPGPSPLAIRILCALFMLGVVGWPSGDPLARSFQVWTVLASVWTMLALAARRQPAVVVELTT